MLTGMSVKRAIIGEAGLVVNAQANGQVNSVLSDPCYAGQQFASDGEENEVNALNGAYTQGQGDWLTSGDAADVWVERFVTLGSWNYTDPGAGRHNLGSSVGFRVRQIATGIQSVTGYFVFHDAASGGNVLQTTSSATWSAENELDPCPLCCFTPETLVTMADGTHVQIADVRAGDLIKVESGIEPVGEVIVRNKRTMYALKLDSGRVLKLSEDHPVHVEHRGYCCVNPIVEYKDMGISERLEVGDRLTIENDTTERVDAIELITYRDDVYTFSNSRFYANGVLVY